MRKIIGLDESSDAAAFNFYFYLALIMKQILMSNLSYVSGSYKNYPKYTCGNNVGKAFRSFVLFELRNASDASATAGSANSLHQELERIGI